MNRLKLFVVLAIGIVQFAHGAKPTVVSSSVDVIENYDFTFAQSDFGYSDSDGDALQSIQVVTLPDPASGVLLYSGSPVSLGTDIMVANISNLVFQPTASYTGTDGFTYKVRAGNQWSNASGPMTVVVTANNSPYTTVAPVINLNEGGTYIFTSGDFNYVDDDGHPFTKIKVAALEGVGDLKLNGTDVTLGQEILVSDLGDLAFSPQFNGFGAGYDNFSYQVHDGYEYSAASTVLTFDVAEVLPTGANKTIIINENASYSFSVVDFGYADGDGDPFTQVRISTINAAATTFVLGGSDVVNGQVVSVANIPNLQIVPIVDQNGNGYVTFDFEVNDGTSYSVAKYQVNVDVVAVNYPPVTADASQVIDEDNILTFSVGDFPFSDADGHTINRVRIISPPANGILYLNNGGTSAFDAGDTKITGAYNVNLTSIPKLSFQPAADGNGSPYTSFTFRVRDNSNTYSVGSNTYTINVNSIEDAPTAVDNTLATDEDTDLGFVVGDFGFADGDGDNFNMLRVVNTVGAGTFFLDKNGDGVPKNSELIKNGTDIAVSDIPQIIFRPVAEANGSAYAVFTFEVEDDGPSNLKSTTHTITIDVTSVNDVPLATDNTLTVDEDNDLSFAVADFGFSDPIDGDSFNKIRISSTVGAGELYVDVNSNGVVDGGELVSNGVVGGIANIPYLKFKPTGNANGTGYASFTFEVADDGTNPADIFSTSHVITIDVVAVNDPPTAADNTLATLEDTNLSIPAATFSFADVDLDNFYQLEVVTTVTGGELYVDANGNGIVDGGELIADGDLVEVADLTNLTFLPALNAHAAPYTEFTFRVVDDGTNAVNEASVSTYTVTINVSPVNDPPTSNDTTVIAYEDWPMAFKDVNFPFADVDTGQVLQGIKISALPSGGILFYETDGNWTADAGEAITVGQVIAVADIPNLKYRPNADQNGTAYDSFGFYVSDGLLFSVSDYTCTIDVVAYNDKPTTGNNAISTDEDIDYSFVDTDFPFADIDGDALTYISMASLPSKGQLYIDNNGNNVVDAGEAVFKQTAIAVADIPKLTFKPVANGFGNPYTSFTFVVSDGKTYSAVGGTMTVTVVAQPDPPTSADNSVSTDEDTDYTFSSGLFAFSDVDIFEGLASIQITTLPAIGQLYLDNNGDGSVGGGEAISKDDVIAVAGISKMKFKPIGEESGVPYDNFQFKVSDGSLSSTSNYTITVNVTGTNDPPYCTADGYVTAVEDVHFTFAASDFTSIYGDPEADALYQIVITEMVTNGILYYDLDKDDSIGYAEILSPGARITVTQMADLQYIGKPNMNGTLIDLFRFRFHDGKTISPNICTMYINITAVNDEPTVANKSFSVPEDTNLSFLEADFGYADPEGDAFSALKITALEARGALYLDANVNGVVDGGEDVVLNQVIPVASIPKLKFLPAADESGSNYASFSFQGSDGALFSNPSKTISIDVTEQQDPPTSNDKTISIVEDSYYDFTGADFAFTDPDINDRLSSVQINALATVGTLFMDANFDGKYDAGEEVAVNDIVTKNNLFYLKYAPALNGQGTPYATFAFKVSDGINLSVTPNTITINVSADNDAPTSANSSVGTAEDVDIVFAVGDFPYVDSDGDAFSSIRIVSPPFVGDLFLDANANSIMDTGEKVTAGREIPVADISSIIFRPGANQSGVPYGTFTFKVSDGISFSVANNTMTINVTNGNDLPTSVSSAISMNEDNTYQFNSSSFNYSDADGDPLAKVKITGLVSVGELFDDANGNSVNDGEDIVLNQELLVANLARLKYKPVANGSGVAYGSFTYAVHDGTAYSAGSYSVTINVASIQDLPMSADNTVGTTENNDLVFTVADFPYTDSDGDALSAVVVDIAVAAGVLFVDADADGVVDAGEQISSGNTIPIASIPSLVFKPVINQSGTPYASFMYRVFDGTGYSVASYTMTINVSNTNNLPTSSDKTVGTNEDELYVFSSSDFNYFDGDGDLFNKVKITGLESVGVLFYDNNGNGTAEPSENIAVNDEIAAANLASLKFVPVLNGNGMDYDSFSFSVHDGIAYSASSYTMTINVNSVNDAPLSSDNTLSTAEDVDYAFALSDFNYSDVEGDALGKVTIVIGVGRGNLYIDGNFNGTIDGGETVNSFGDVALADIPNLKFKPVANENGSPYTTFIFKVTDGVASSASTYTMTINVGAVNESPYFTAPVLTVGTELTPYQFNITSVDADGDPLVVGSTVLPSWLSLVDAGDGSGNAVLSGTPPISATGVNNVTLNVTDGIVTVPWSFTITVGTGIYVPDDYPTIQSAIDAISSGTTVIVREGTYTENVNYRGKDITLASEYFIDGNATHIANTVIDGNQTGSCVAFYNRESSAAKLIGFTLQNGSGTLTEGLEDLVAYKGGGVFIYNSSPTLSNLVVANNTVAKNGVAGGSGGGIYCRNGAPVIRGVTVDNNDAPHYQGGGICLEWCRSVVVLENVTITQNYANAKGGGLVSRASVLNLSNVVVQSNIVDGHEAMGGGVYVVFSTVSGSFSTSSNSATVSSTDQQYIFAPIP